MVLIYIPPWSTPLVLSGLGVWSTASKTNRHLCRTRFLSQTQALPGTYGDPCHSFILMYSFLTLMVVSWLYKTVSLFWENTWKYSGLECLEVSNLLLNGVGKIETLIKQMEHNAILWLYFCSFSLGLKRDWSCWVGWVCFPGSAWASRALRSSHPSSSRWSVLGVGGAVSINPLPHF